MVTALDKVYSTLYRILVFTNHIAEDASNINVIRLQQLVHRSLNAFKEGPGGLYGIMCRVLLNIPTRTPNIQTIDSDIVPDTLHGISRGDVFDNAYIILTNVRRVLKDLRQDLNSVINAMKANGQDTSH